MRNTTSWGKALVLVTIAASTVACQEKVNDLVFTRGDGSVINFSPLAKLHAWCGPYEEGLIPAPALHIVQFGPGEKDPVWMLKAVIADVKPGVPLTFPHSFIWDKPTGVNLFVAEGQNEASTAEEESAGSLTFHQLSCGEGGVVDFSVDAVAGSELSDLSPITIKGSFRHPVGPAPAP